MHTPIFRLQPIKNVYFKNPFVVLAHPTPLTNPNGRVTPELLMHFKALARTEAAMVIAGPATVTPPQSRRQSLLRADQPKYMDGLRALTKIIESNGSMPGLQLVHPDGFEADDILAGPCLFRPMAEEPGEERLLSMYRNACQRAFEVGFRYVELSAGGFLWLHRAIVENRRVLVQSIIKIMVDAAGELGLTGLRLAQDMPRRDEYERLFLDLGGDMVAYEIPFDDPEPVQPQSAAAMPTLNRPAMARDIRKKLRSAKLIGLPVRFRDKRKQIYHFLRDA